MFRAIVLQHCPTVWSLFHFLNCLIKCRLCSSHAKFSHNGRKILLSSLALNSWITLSHLLLFVVSKCVFVKVCIYIFTGERGNIGAHAVRPWARSEGQGDALRGACADGLLGGPGLPEMQSSGENFISLEIRCISAEFDLANSLPCSLLKLPQW